MHVLLIIKNHSCMFLHEIKSRRVAESCVTPCSYIEVGLRIFLVCIYSCTYKSSENSVSSILSRTHHRTLINRWICSNIKYGSKLDHDDITIISRNYLQSVNQYAYNKLDYAQGNQAHDKHLGPDMRSFPFENKVGQSNASLHSLCPQRGQVMEHNYSHHLSLVYGGSKDQEKRPYKKKSWVLGGWGVMGVVQRLKYFKTRERERQESSCTHVEK